MKRTYIALLLALVLGLTGQSMAVMRTMAGPSGEVVLCTGSGPIRVLVDAGGAPMAAPHICPDCAMSVFDGVVELPDFAVRPVGAVARVGVVREGVERSIHQLMAQARGPPDLA